MTAPDSRPAPLARAAVWLLPRLLWTWPMRPARWVGRKTIDRTRLAFQIGSPFMIGTIATLLAWAGVEAGWWGKTVVTAWHNEAVARQNVVVLKKDLDLHSRVQPPTQFFWLSA